MGAAVPVLRMEPSVAPLDRPPDSEMGEAIDYTKACVFCLLSVMLSASCVAVLVPGEVDLAPHLSSSWL